MIVQIYEVSTPEEAIALEGLGVDHIGVLVGNGAFPRELPTTSARSIFKVLQPATKRVALSLSDRLEDVSRVVADTMPDFIHVGAAVELLPVDRMRELKAAFPDVLLMRAIPVIVEESLPLAKHTRISPTSCCSIATSRETRRSARLGASTIGTSVGGSPKG